MSTLKPLDLQASLFGWKRNVWLPIFSWLLAWVMPQPGSEVSLSLTSLNMLLLELFRIQVPSVKSALSFAVVSAVVKSVVIKIPLKVFRALTVTVTMLLSNALTSKVKAPSSAGVKSGIFPSTLWPAGTKRHLGAPLEKETTARGIAKVRRRTKTFIL